MNLRRVLARAKCVSAKDLDFGLRGSRASGDEDWRLTAAGVRYKDFQGWCGEGLGFRILFAWFKFKLTLNLI